MFVSLFIHSSYLFLLGIIFTFIYLLIHSLDSFYGTWTDVFTDRQSLYLTGFKAVESGFPSDIPIEELSNARETAQIEHVFMNAFDGKHLWGLNDNNYYFVSVQKEYLHFLDF